jgi:hypothetical protein
VAAADAADVATTDAATDAADVATTDAATRSVGSRRDCGAAHKNGGDRCHHHSSEHQSLHSYIFFACLYIWSSIYRNSLVFTHT